LQAGESLEETVWDGGEIVVVKVELLEGREVCEGRDGSGERVGLERERGELGKSVEIGRKST
jgi:hypothetical protein